MVGVDIVPAAIVACHLRIEALTHKDAEQARRKCQFTLGDIFQLPDDFCASFDLLYDCQTFHALVRTAPQVASIMVSCLKPGGYLLLLTGNASEPEVGPTTLSENEILIAFSELQCVWRYGDSRFDMTEFYRQLVQPPLAWCFLFRKAPTHCA